MDNRRVAIFDDEEDILSICTFILEESGWQVSGFSNCDNIVSNMTALVPAVILMDNQIPEIGGVEATRLLKKNEILKSIPVIYFSANNDIALLANEAGAQAFLSKPFDLYDLDDIILSVLN